MAKTISVKLRDDILREAEQLVANSPRSRNAYFNEAIHFYNQVQKRKRLEKALSRESELVAPDSLAVLAAFEALADELPE